MLKRLLIVVAVAVLALLAVSAWRAVRVQPLAVPVAAIPAIAIDAEASAARLARAIAFATVSRDGAGDRHATDELLALERWLRAQFPRVFAALAAETVGGHSLLLRWPGRDPAARPFLFAAHLDVVPVAPGSRPDWQHPPFAGVVADGFVWGRGALDDKSSVLALLEAVDALLARDFQPATDVYLAFGHDEEVGGDAGAVAIAALLRERGVRLACVLDEGSFVFDGVLSQATRPIALVGVAEKGVMTVELDARGSGGHASLAPRDNPVLAISRAIARIDATPFPARASEPVRAFLDALAPDTAPQSRLLLANRWWTEPLLVRSLAAKPLTAAMVRTTVAPTVLVAGDKDNVVPQRATARLNVRLLTGDDSARVLSELVAAIDDPQVTATARPPVHEPSPMSATDGAAWDALAGAIGAIFPDAALVPGPVVATTDTRHYVAIADQVYRFLPVRLAPADVARVHGNDERIAVSAYADAIRFYATVIAGWRGADGR